MHVVVSDHVFDNIDVERALIEPLGATVTLAPSQDEETLVRLAGEADAMLVCFAPITARVVEAAAANGCKVIARYGIGVDNIDTDAARRLGVRVTNVPDYCLGEVADHTLALLLAVARQVVFASRGIASGGWEVPHGRVHRIQGRRLALLGVGRIGREVATRANAFGLEVVGFDPFVTGAIPGLELVETPEQAVAQADFVSLHMPLTQDTRHIVDDGLIAEMQRSPVLVNTSRGGLVDLDAAWRGLEAERLSALALDVTEPEPLAADSPLRTDPRVVVTPHMAFYSDEATRDLQQRAADEIARALRGEPARSPVA